MRFAGASILLGLMSIAFPAPAAADCRPPRDDEALSAYLGAYAECAEALTESVASAKAGASATTQAFQAASPSSPGTAGFASGLRDSIEDFLSLFSFAVDGLETSDDDTALTLRFNPIRSGEFGSLALAITAAEPAASEILLETVAEENRATVREGLEAALDDSDNLSFAAAYGFERRAGQGRRWLLGRSYETYADFVEGDLLPLLAQPTFSGEEASQAVSRCETLADEGLRRIGRPADEAQNPVTARVEHVRAALGVEYEACLAVWQQSEARVVNAAKKLEALGWIPFLIDNQPQLFLKAEVTDRAEEVGRSGWNMELTYEKGFNNLNTFLRATAGKSGDERVQAFHSLVDGLTTQEVEAQNKLSFALRYAERDAFAFDRLIGSGADTVAVSVDLPRATETCGKIAYHRNATWHPLEIGGQTVFPKFHMSLEYVDVSDDPARRDRLVGTATYEIPLPSGTALPLSLSYANHAEFLGESDRRLSAHFGFSYKLPGR